MRLLSDRIYGGNCAPDRALGTAGVIAKTVGTIQIVDPRTSTAATCRRASGTSSASGVEIGGTAPAIAFDTIYTGAWAGDAIVLDTGTTRAPRA